MQMLLVACTQATMPVIESTAAPATEQLGWPSTLQATSTASAPITIPTLPPAPRLLTICMGREPETLFPYQATFSSRSILQAVYDGPFDVRGYRHVPVILTKNPTLADGDVALEAVDVFPGDLIVDTSGALQTLSEGVIYRPSGCTQADCAQPYTGSQPIRMDQLVIHFQLLPELLWSDGVPLTADDSVYAFEVERALFAGQGGRLDWTFSYRALDETTLEWRGLPGYYGALPAQLFFSPLPRHAWGNLAPETLSTAEKVTQTPLGWGPYIIEEWVRGDHITLKRNPHYFRSAEGLPRFDYLVFRFVSGSAEGLAALQAGECDLVDVTATYDLDLGELLTLREKGVAIFFVQPETAWEVAFFGIRSFDEQRPNLFGLKEVRQAVAMCINRQEMVDRLFYGQGVVAESYLPPSHPLSTAANLSYPYDPKAATDLLSAVGWLDPDNDPATPRLSQGVAGVPDGTLFQFTYLVSMDAERQQVAYLIQEDLADCGIRAIPSFQESVEYLASGPQGVVFGRRFDAAQFALQTFLEPPCSLFVTGEIPGPYPDFSKGWGGANATGYSNSAFDLACRTAQTALFASPEYIQAHQQAIAIFLEDLPALPLYWRFRVAVARPDFCGFVMEPGPVSSLQYLERYQYGEDCQRP